MFAVRVIVLLQDPRSVSEGSSSARPRTQTSGLGMVVPGPTITATMFLRHFTFVSNGQVACSSLVDLEMFFLVQLDESKASSMLLLQQNNLKMCGF